MRVKSIILSILFCLALNGFAEGVYDESIVAIDRGLSKKEDTILVTALNRSIELYKSQPNQKYLTRVLKRFDKILKRKDAYFIVENFLGIYLQDKKKFEQALSKSLSKSDQKRFMDNLKAIVKEMENGNG